VLEDKELDRDTNGKVNNKQGTRKAIDILDGKFYYEITISSKKRCDF